MELGNKRERKKLTIELVGGTGIGGALEGRFHDLRGVLALALLVVGGAVLLLRGLVDTRDGAAGQLRGEFLDGLGGGQRREEREGDDLELHLERLLCFFFPF